MAQFTYEYSSVWEILGLSPNADSAMVRRTLSSLVQTTALRVVLERNVLVKYFIYILSPK